LKSWWDLQTYELRAPDQKAKDHCPEGFQEKVEASSEDDSEEEEKVVAMLAKNFRRLMRGPRCFECSGFGHIRADCGNLKKGKGKAYNVTLSDESEEEEAQRQWG